MNTHLEHLLNTFNKQPSYFFIFWQLNCMKIIQKQKRRSKALFLKDEDKESKHPTGEASCYCNSKTFPHKDLCVAGLHHTK